eukprot:EG_transcript_2181
MSKMPPSIVIPIATIESTDSMLASPMGRVVASSPRGVVMHASIDLTDGGSPTGRVVPFSPKTIESTPEPRQPTIPLLGSRSEDHLLGNNHDAPSQSPELAGAELLRSVFDTMAVNGKITMDQLPFVLAGAELQATPEQVHESIEHFVPDADDGEALLEYDAVQTLYQQLVQVVTEQAAKALMQQAEQERRPSVCRRMWQWLRQRNKERKLKHTAYERHLKPTMRLLLLILTSSCVISTAVVVFSVFLIYNNSNNAVIDHLVRGTELLSDGMGMFGYTRPVEHTTSNFQRLSSTLNLVIDQLGYAVNRDTELSGLALQRDVTGDLLEAWYTNDATLTVGSAVNAVALWVERMVARGTPLAGLVSLVNAINPTLPDGQEIQLARAGGGGQPQFLTAVRYPCAGGCGANNGSTAIQLALAGGNGTTVAGYDYRLQPVAAGYRLLVNPAGVALVYSYWQSTLQADFQPSVKAVGDAINARLASEANSTAVDIRVNSAEVVLSTKLGGATQNLTTLRFCNATCMQAATLEASYLALATNTTWQGTATDLTAEPVLIAYKPLPASGLGIEVKVTQEEFLDGLYSTLGKALNEANGKLYGTQELQAVTTPKPVANVSTNNMRYWTNFRFASSCKTTCGKVANTSTYLQTALNSCVSGTDHSLDYRSTMVIAGYFCVPSMKVAVSVTVADSQIVTDGQNMAVVISDYQTLKRYANTSTEVAIVRKKAGLTVALTRNDFSRLNARKYANQCPAALKGQCTGPAVGVQLAVNGATGYVQGQDYRYVDCMTAYTYINSLALGIIVKIDTSEAQAPTFRLIAIVCGASVSAVVVTMALLAVFTNVLLRSMDQAWEEGRRAIEREKQAFRTVIEAMYPAEVAQRMLTGDTHIVYDVQAATVFFSDIFEFTTASNSVTPEELIRFMGYTFGVMDAIGDYYHVYKVKTIGDAYLGVTGLPGMISVNGSAAMDMLLFASVCARRGE